MNAAHTTPASQPRRPRSPEFVRTAKALLLRQRTREAINLLRRGLNLDPTCNQAALLLAKCLVAAKRLNEARSTLEKLIDREESAASYLLLVRVCAAQGDHAAAIEAARRGLASFPDEHQLRELRQQSRGELAKLLKDTAEREGEPAEPVDPEDLPTARMEEGGGRSRPFDHLLAEAGAEASVPDTVQVPGTALTLPPVPEELATSPNYRQAGDGALEDPLVVKPAVDRSERTPTPLPSDDLDFDRAPGAPDVISAVKRLVEPTAKPAPGDEPGGLFQSLLGDGPPTRSSRPRANLRVVPPLEDQLCPPTSRDDPDEVGGPTPADTPGARQRRRRRAAARRGLDNPTLDLRGKTPPRGKQQPPGGKKPRLIEVDNPGDAQVGEMVSVTPPPQVTMPSPHAPRVQIPELDRMAARIEEQLEAPRRQPAGPTEPVEVIEEASLLARWWPLWLTIALLVIASATVAGLVVRQRAKVSRNLTLARTLAARHQVGPLKLALRRVRQAANLGGRSPQTLALAARIHAELAYKFGESTPGGAATLVEESARLDAESLPRARSDLAVARAYLQLSREPLPEALGYLLKALERHPHNLRIKLLYGEALVRNGELKLAADVLEELPAEDLEVLQARALLYWKSGQHGLATRLMRLAGTLGLSPGLVELTLARFEVLDGDGDARALRSLEQLLRGDLPARQRSWASLLLAVIYNEHRQQLKAEQALDRALAHPPVADAEFRYRAGRILLALHRQDAALAQAREASRIAPRDPRYNTLQAAVELAMDRPEAVIARFKDSAEAELGEEARLVLARALIQAGELSRARTLLKSVPDQSSRQYRLVAARLELAAGKPYRAVQHVAGLDSQPVEPQIIRGLAAMALEERGRATRWMKTALKKDPLQADALWALGAMARQRGDARHAVEYLRKAVKANPYHREARLALGRLQLGLGSFAAAQRQFDELLLLQPGSLAGLIGRARTAVEQGSNEAKLYIRALRVRGHNSRADLLEARLAMVQGHLRRARRSLQDLLDHRRVDDRPRVLLWLAQAAHRLGDLERAAMLYDQVVAMRRPGPAPAARLGLSELALARGSLGTAVRQGQAAANELSQGIFPLGLRARIGVQLARCYREGDALGAAIAELQDVLELDRTSLEANLELGKIYGSLNKRDRAAQYLSRVLELDRDNSQARAELTRVCQDLSPSPPECRR